MATRGKRSATAAANVQLNAEHFAIVKAMGVGTYDLDELEKLKISVHGYHLNSMFIKKPIEELASMGYVTKLKRHYDDTYTLHSSASTLVATDFNEDLLNNNEDENGDIQRQSIKKKLKLWRYLNRRIKK